MLEVLVKNEEFKDSPVGKIPKDWEVKPLSELADVDRGKFTHRPRNDPAFYGGLYPFIQTGDITNSFGGILTEYSQTLNERGIAVSREFPVGTIAITIAANIADTAILGIPMYFPDSVVGAVVKYPNSIRYVELCIRRAKQQLNARAPQSAQKNINLEDLRPLLIPVPSIEEQHRIAEILDTVDEAIARTSSLIIKLKQTKAGLLQDLLTRGLDEDGKLRDPQAHPEQFKDSPLGQIPKEWDVTNIGSLTFISSGSTPNRINPAYWQDGIIPWVKTGEINYTVIDNTEEKVTQKALEETSLTLYPLGTVLIAMYGQGVTRGKVAILGIEATTNQACAAMIPNNISLSSGYLFHYLSYHYENIRSISHGSNQSNLNENLIASFLLKLPPVREQNQIIQIIDTHDSRIRAEEAYLKKLKLQKQGLMQDLLTGKVRVRKIK